MINEFTMATVSKSIIKDFDDGETIFLDYEKLTDEEINNVSLGSFDIININCSTDNSFSEIIDILINFQYHFVVIIRFR